jgi:hypothetical protein
MYHCGTAPVAMHIANGMYGALIVDPLTPRPRAREFVLVQSELYLNPQGAEGSLRSLDWKRLLELSPDYVLFKGRAAQYAGHPIVVAPGDLIRLYVVNAGPNRISSFHVVGAIFERVFQDGSLKHPLEGVQTVNVPVGGGMIFETRLREPGDYPFVTHAFADATKELWESGAQLQPAQSEFRVAGGVTPPALADGAHPEEVSSLGCAAGPQDQTHDEQHQDARECVRGPLRPSGKSLPEGRRDSHNDTGRHADGGQSPDRPDTRRPRRFRFRGSGGYYGLKCARLFRECGWARRGRTVWRGLAALGNCNLHPGGRL